MVHRLFPPLTTLIIVVQIVSGSFTPIPIYAQKVQSVTKPALKAVPPPQTVLPMMASSGVPDSRTDFTMPEYKKVTPVTGGIEPPPGSSDPKWQTGRPGAAMANRVLKPSSPGAQVMGQGLNPTNVNGQTVTVNTKSTIVDGKVSSINDLILYPGPDGYISFPEALQAVNNTGSGNTINFNIPEKSVIAIPEDQAGTWQLNVGNTIIDGQANPGVATFVQIVPFGKYISLSVLSDHNTIRNLAIQELAIETESATYNTVFNCYIGTNASGKVSTGLEENGIEIRAGASKNILLDNVIAGNAGADQNFSSIGVSIWAGAHDNTLKGNKIGVSPNGAALPNEYGVTIGNMPWQTGGEPYGDVHGNVVGLLPGNTRNNDTCIDDCNLIAANNLVGVLIYGPKAIDNIVAGNYIGVASDGVTGLGNKRSGVSLEAGASTNTIGGDRGTETTCRGACNLIGANQESGIGLVGTGTMLNHVVGNRIGVGRDGQSKLPNAFSGIILQQGASQNTLGGLRSVANCSGLCNWIANNNEAGVYLVDTGTSNNLLEGNRLSSNLEGGAMAMNGPTQNTIGGARDTSDCLGSCNDITANSLYGIGLQGQATQHNTIRGNNYDGNSGLNIDLLQSEGIGVDLDGANNAVPAPAIFDDWATNLAAFANVPDNSIVEYYDQGGKRYLGHAGVISKETGGMKIKAIIPPVVASVTTPEGDTSEFSASGDLHLSSPIVLPGGHLYAWANLMNPQTGASIQPQAGMTLSSSDSETPLLNDGTNGDLKGNDDYASGWLTAQTKAGKYSLALSYHRVGVMAIHFNVIIDPKLAVLTDLQALHQEFDRTYGGDINSDDYITAIYGAIQRLSDYANLQHGVFLDLKQEIKRTSPTDSTPYENWVYNIKLSNGPLNRFNMGVAIDNYIATLATYQSTLKYLAIIGDDAVVPFYRRQSIKYEKEDKYPTKVGGPKGNFTLIDSSLDKIMTDRPYASFNADPPDSVKKPAPDLAIGRIYYPDPVSLTSSIDAYGMPVLLTPVGTAVGLYANDEPDPGVWFKTTFERDILPELRKIYPNELWSHNPILPVDLKPGTLYTFDGSQNPWQPLSVKDSVDKTWLTVIYEHGNMFSELTPSSDLFRGPFLGVVPVRPGTIVINNSCHTGYSVSRQANPGAPAFYSDALVTYFLQRDVTYIAPTVYGIGANKSLQWHDRLFRNILSELMGTASTVGEAYRLGQARYNAERPGSSWGPADTYITYGTELYGLPTQPLLNQNPPADLFSATKSPEIADQAIQVGLSVTLSVDTPGFRVVNNTDGTTRFELPNTGTLDGAEFYPLLPEVEQRLFLPAGAVVSGVTMVDQISQVYPQSVTLETLTPINRTNGPVEGNATFSGIYPTEHYTYTTTTTDDGVILTLLAYPLSYNTTSHQVTLFNHMGLKVDYTIPSSDISITSLVVNNGQPVNTDLTTLPLHASISSATARLAYLTWRILDPTGSEVKVGQMQVNLTAGSTSTTWTANVPALAPGPKRLNVTLAEDGQVVGSADYSFKVQGRSLEASLDQSNYSKQTAGVLAAAVYNENGVGVSGMESILKVELDGTPFTTTFTALHPGEYRTSLGLTRLAEGRHQVVINLAGTPSVKFGFTVDRTPPQATIDTLPGETNSIAIDIHFSGKDNLSGIAKYQFQYRVGETGQWTDWMSKDAYLVDLAGETALTFGPDSPVTVEIGETYAIRVQAVDKAGNTSAYPETGFAVTTVIMPSYPQQVVELVNVYRAANGLSPLKLQSELTTAAQWLAKDMATFGYLDHTDRLGRTYEERLQQFGYTGWSHTSELIASSDQTPGAVIKSWLQDPSSKTILLDPQLTEVGAGFGSNPSDVNQYYWVLDLGSRPMVYPIVINHEQTLTTQRTVQLDIDGSGWATQMRLSNDDQTWSDWMPYQPTLIWSLAPGDGLQKVYVELTNGSQVLLGDDEITVIAASSVDGASYFWAWGDNTQGQLGIGSSGNKKATPEQINNLQDIRQVAAGESFSLALKQDGTLWAWGDNSKGQLGDGTTTPHLVPIQVRGLTGVVTIAAGAMFSLAVKADGSLWAWGENAWGQLGDGTTIQRLEPVQVLGIGPVKTIAAGFSHSLAVLKADGSVWAWGNNGDGQLGDKSHIERHTPVPIPLSGIQAVSAGDYHSLALTDDGTVLAWGDGLFGQIGNGGPLGYSLPQYTNIWQGKVIAIASSHNQNLAVLANGTVWGWGENSSNQLGIVTTQHCGETIPGDYYLCSLLPVQAPGLVGIRTVAAGYEHSLALATSGKLWAWGGNSKGQLGDSTITNRPEPVALTRLNGMAVIAAGGQHSLAASSLNVLMPLPPLPPPPTVPNPLPPSPSVLSNQPWLVKDIRPGGDPMASSDPHNFVASGSLVYFAASTPDTGIELWVTDGTTPGTRLVKDIRPGPKGSDPQKLTVSNGLLFFTAHDGSSGRELWRSDGTAQGTFPLGDIFPFDPEISPDPYEYYQGPGELAAVKGLLFFTANDSLDMNYPNWELWKSDGTPAGTSMVVDLSRSFAHNLSSDPKDLTSFNGKLYFTARNISWPDDDHPYYWSYGYELWTSDGTAEGTVLVKDIYPGGYNTGENLWMGYSSNPIQMTVVGNTLFFAATTATNGLELWKTDGTQAGTVQVKDIASGVADSFPQNLVDVNGLLYFSADNGVSGRELWVSDGSQAGTRMVKDITPGAGGGFILNLTPVGGKLYFLYQQALWQSDGTTQGTQPVPLPVDNPYPGSPFCLTGFGNNLYFIAGTQSAGTHLWKTDGTAAGTHQVSDVLLTCVTPRAGMLYFSGALADSGSELWKTDGSRAGTVRIKDIDPGWWGSGGDITGSMGTSLGPLVFQANDGVHGAELWASNAQPDGTQIIKDINPGLPDSNPENLFKADKITFFTASNPIHGNELYMTYATSNTTQLVVDISPLDGGSKPSDMTVYSGSLFFTASDPSDGCGLYRTNGSEAGTLRLEIFGEHCPKNLTVVGKILFFTWDHQLWKTDGLETGTEIVKDWGEHLNDILKDLIDYHGTLYFLNGNKLWKSDGSEAGTVNLTSFNMGLILDMKLVGDLFYLLSEDDYHNSTELWRSDGTTDGTWILETALGAHGGIQNLTPLNGVLLFTFNDKTHGWELWLTDGSVQGTRLLKDINPGLSGSNPSDFVAFPERNAVLFAASDGIHGKEVWQTNGSEAGTFMVSDIAPGAASSNPQLFIQVGDVIFFYASDGSHGMELWAMPVHTNQQKVYLPFVNKSR